ncbi:hypothetical protein AVEN_120742-1 [Araneus ventricosus]|uniref:Uncharacterized protein n=1 Tax=Araneus ventricosus TaxID=182803 RepID=A0A4Y2VGT1_ARAVE|nr:hypothetical protein AVEN_120742-1 [Araneus ventricosus]
MKRGGPKPISSSSVCRRSPNFPQDRIFKVKCELLSILYMSEVSRQSVKLFRRNSKKCENLQVSGYFWAYSVSCNDCPRLEPMSAGFETGRSTDLATQACAENGILK